MRKLLTLLVALLWANLAAATTLGTQPFKVADYTGLAALAYQNLATNDVAIDADTVKGGTFLWQTGDQSANITADPQKCLWVPPTGATSGSSGAWLRRWDGNRLNGVWCGMSTGAGNNLTALAAAVDQANLYQNAEVFVPAGCYTGGGVLSSTTVSTNRIRIVGAAPSYWSDGFERLGIAGSIGTDVYNALHANGYAGVTVAPPSSLCGKYTVFYWATSFIGDVDTGTNNSAVVPLDLHNFFLWANTTSATPSSLIGIHTTAYQTKLEDISVFRFKNYGIIARGGDNFWAYRVAAMDNGWGLTATGSITAAPMSYQSGADFVVSGVIVAGDYTNANAGGITGPPSTVRVDTIYVGHESTSWANGGLDGFQFVGLHDGTLQNMESITGNIFALSGGQGGGIIQGGHIENYSLDGPVIGDNTPVGLEMPDGDETYQGFLQMHTSGGHTAGVAVNAFCSGATGVSCTHSWKRSEVLSQDYPAYNTKSVTTTITTPGSAQNVTFGTIAFFQRYVNDAEVHGSFAGDLWVTVTDAANLSVSTACRFEMDYWEDLAVGVHNVGTALPERCVTNGTSTSIFTINSLSVVDKGSVTVNLTPGSGWTGGASITVQLSAHGSAPPTNLVTP